MPMYNRLLISADDGIISKNQQADQANAATICIGLGGTYDYCALGVSAVYLPYKEITTYISAKILEKFAL